MDSPKSIENKPRRTSIIAKRLGIYATIFLCCCLIYYGYKVYQRESRISAAIARFEANIPPALKQSVHRAKRLVLAADKSTRTLKVMSETGTLIESYNFTGFSGGPGPKRAEGDGQIPEGIYPITVLNPQSYFYLSLRIGYPNSLDIRYNQDNAGSDIYIHGKTASIGCIPLGDKAIEQLFWAVREIGMHKTSVVIYSSTYEPLDRYEEDVNESITQFEQQLGWAMPGRTPVARQ